MRDRYRAGFTLVEVMLAAGLLAAIIVVLTDIFPDILRIHSQENLSYQVNWETQRILARLKEDIQTAGLRFLPPSTVDGAGNPVLAVETPAQNQLVLRCISEVGQLAAQASSGQTMLSVAGFRNLAEAEALIWTYEGQSGYQRISLVLNNGNQVVIQPGLTLSGTRPLPAGTPLVAVRRIEYQINAENFLVRRINGTVTDRVAIDPTATRFQYTVGTSVQNALTSSDLDNLRFVNVSLRLVRTAAVPGGRRVSITGSAVERIAPLNLRGF